MATKLIHKNSKVQFKNATGAQLEFGELALNYHASGPYLQAKGEDGEVHSLGGVYIGSSAPSNPLPGRWWFDDANSKLFLYDGSAWQIITGSGGGGSSTTVVGGDGIVVSTSGSTATVAVDLASSANGLLISSGKLQAHIATASDLGTVKIGDGIDVDAAGEISVDLSGIDVNADLDYTPAVDKGTVTNTAGDDATIPIADATNAGLFTAAEKAKLAGLPVTVGETPPSTPADGDLWWNSSDDSGRLYVYYDEGPVGSKQWVEASPQGDTLTESDADDLYLSKVSDDTAAGAITFEKVTTHEAGVKVTGGTFDNVQEGIVSTISDGNTRNFLIAGGGSSYIGCDSRGYSGVNYLNTICTFNVQTTQDQYIGVRYIYEGTVDVDKTEQYGYYANIPRVNTENTVDKVSGYFTGLAASRKSGTTTIGYESNVDNSSVTGQSNYNFYAEGSAPNYFAGTTKIGNKEAIDSLGGNGYLQIGFVDDNLGAITTSVGSSLRMTHIRFKTNHPDRLIGSIVTNGGSCSYNDLSDYRLKTEIATFSTGSASERVKALNPCQYQFIDEPDGVIHEGFLAHELQEIVPTAVTGGKDEVDEEGNPVYQMVDRSKIVPLLTKALQETIAKNEELEARLAALEGA